MSIHPSTSPSLPSPPFIHLHGIANFRDLGGWPLASSSPHHPKSVRRNYIFRCAEPTKAPPETVEKIRALGITHIYDLRAAPEIRKMQVSSGEEGGDGVVRWEGVERVYVPVHPEEAYDAVSLAVRHGDYLEEGDAGRIRAYKVILEQGATAYTRIIRHVLSHPPPNNAFIVHCTAGKDRTGVLCALLLSLCGVDDNIVAEEYALTEAGLGAWTELLVGAIMSWQDGIKEEAARRMVGAKKESMVATLEMLRKDYGGAEQYFKERCGLSEDEIEKIKGYLIVDEKAVCKLL